MEIRAVAVIPQNHMYYICINAYNRMRLSEPQSLALGIYFASTFFKFWCISGSHLMTLSTIFFTASAR